MIQNNSMFITCKYYVYILITLIILYILNLVKFFKCNKYLKINFLAHLIINIIFSNNLID